jgi:HK97 family phage major capsid protein
LYQRSYQLGQILPRVKALPIGAGANGILMNAFEDSNLSNGIVGGIIAYWDFESGTITGTKPKFRQIDMKLQKVRALCYATDEMLEDATALEGVIMEGVPKAIQLKVENSIFNGTGAGQCLGILNSGAKVKVPKEGGQGAATIVYANVLNMWNRMVPDSRANAVWFINLETEPQLMTMSQVVGVGGVPVWLPAGGASASPFSTLFGRPVIPTQYNAALGTEGDIAFADLGQYLSINKGPVQAATSIHVQFLTGEQAFRFTYRINGQPLWDAPFTPLNGTKTYSPFVTLATRS